MRFLTLDGLEAFHRVEIFSGIDGVLDPSVDVAIDPIRLIHRWPVVVRRLISPVMSALYDGRGSGASPGSIRQYVPIFLPAPSDRPCRAPSVAGVDGPGDA